MASSDEHNLDDPGSYSLLDPSGLRVRIGDLASHCRAAWKTAGACSLPPEWSTADRVLIGGMGGSTGGGMKVIRVMLLAKYGAMETRRMLHTRALIPIRIGKRYINEDVVRNTMGFFLFFMSSFAIATLILSAMGLDLETAVGAAASAMGNIGPGLGDFGPTENYALLSVPGKWVLAFCMLLGRLEIFTVMVLFSRTFWK